MQFVIKKTICLKVYNYVDPVLSTNYNNYNYLSHCVVGLQKNYFKSFFFLVLVLV